MEDYKLLNPGAVESSAPNKKCKLVEAVVKSKKRKIVESQNDERDEDDEDDDEDDESNAQLDASGSDDNDDDAESKSNSGIESSQDGSTPETKKAILNAASVRPETARVKAVRAKAAESVRANIFESKKPGPSSAQKVKKTTQVYPMNPNTVPDEELAHARVLPHITAHLPTDYIPTVDSKVVIIRQAYVEFLDTVPPRIMKTLDAARTQGKENICDLPSPTLTGDVTAVKKFETNLKVNYNYNHNYKFNCLFLISTL